MAASLKSLELEDFKTYHGRHVIGPFQPFTGIIGPNGGGKSNLMDAVAFVLGGRMAGLRVDNPRELIHRDQLHDTSSSETDAQPPSASVTATFTLQDGGEQAFKRVATAQGSTFFVEGESVPWARYHKKLKKLGVNAACRNFMVFQGTVESIATQGSRKKTELFEEISRSGELAEEYKRLKDEMVKAEEKASSDFERHRMVMMDLKDCKMDIKKEKEYMKMEKECENARIKLHLFRIFHIEKKTSELEKELKLIQEHMKDIEEKEKEQTKMVEKNVEKHGLAVKEITTQDHSFGDLEMKLNRKRSEVITAKELLRERKSKEEQCCKLLSKAKERQETQQGEIKALEEELRTVERLAAQYEVELSQESLRMGTDIQLEEEQLHEYRRLRYEAAQRCATHQQKLSHLSRQHKTKLDSLANEERRITEGRECLQRKEDEVKEARKRANMLKEKLEVLVKAQTEKNVKFKEYEERVTTQKGKVETLRNELAAVTEELSEAVWDVSQVEKLKEKQELVATLRKLFPGVYDRLSNLCEPIHERYQVAITRVLIQHMDSIVVDTETTARRCMNYLRDKCIGRETFLPLNYLQPYAIRESLRAIEDPPHVKLAFDLLKYEPPNIKTAVLFATKNTLVCETPEDAMKVAYELCGDDGSERRLNAVALDGTFYSKSGLISGGKMDLEKKAKRWGEKNMVTMRKKKDSLMEELKKAQSIAREESEMKVLEAQVRSLAQQIKYIALEENSILKNIDEIEEEVKKIEKELQRNTKTHKELEAKLAEQDMEITEIQTEVDTVENEVFASFCEEIHVPNIRLYEEQGLQIVSDRANKRLHFEKQKSRIQSQIDYERSRDKEENVEKWNAALETQRALVEKANEDEREKVKEAEEVMRDFAKGKAKKIEKERVVKVMEEEVKAAQEKAKKIRKQKGKVQQKIFMIKQQIRSMKSERYDILKQCCIKSIPLPLTSGSLQHKSLRGGPPLGSSTTQSSISTPDTSSLLIESQGSEPEIRVDFSALPRVYWNLEGEEYQMKAETHIQKKIATLEMKLTAMQPPSKNTDERLEQAAEQTREMKSLLERRQDKASDARTAFLEVKQERRNLFMNCFSAVAAKIDEVYKGLYQSNQAQALLEMNNPEEPYLGSIVYHCIPPGKRCQTMWGLSGGEKSVAALAFLFALHSYHPAPFFLLDEVDAALDKRNIHKVSEYIRQQREEVEMLVISHRLDFYHKANALFGITYNVVNEYPRSKTYSLDLMQFRKRSHKRQDEKRHLDESHSEGRHSDESSERQRRSRKRLKRQ